MTFTISFADPIFWIILVLTYLVAGIITGRTCYKYNWLNAHYTEEKIVATLMILFWPLAVVGFLIYYFILLPFSTLCTFGVKQKY